MIELRARRNSLHPWIFKKMVRPPKKRLPCGAPVTVVTREGEFVGRGIYNPVSNIAVRLLTERESEPLDWSFFRAKLAEARRLREEILGIGRQSDSYRLIHGEADGLSGLMVDKYADVLVIEPYSAGYVYFMDALTKGLRELYPSCRMVVRPDAKHAVREGVEKECAELARRHPAPESVVIQENGVRMKVDFRAGHKTGFFLDQRENRREAAQMSAGRRVLDLFCYTGGFSIAAALGKAASVTGVDLDEKALRTAGENARMNGAQVEFLHADVFDHLRGMVARGDLADLVIADPAKLAGVRDEIPRARRTYGDLNRLAMKAVRPGGVLLTCSCSGLISEPDFLSILTRSAAEAGVVFQAFRIAGAAGDHPVSSIFPEGRYLKAVFARIYPATSRRVVAD